ncbi:hypothetical protein GCM10007082_02700 [Oceanisphaera arctica]|nr:hypothetical protein GCM10007082_02700 [Oceanisphaera arctica]
MLCQLVIKKATASLTWANRNGGDRAGHFGVVEQYGSQMTSICINIVQG